MWTHDLRYAWRLLTRTPSFTLTAVVTLALGIGANTAIFSVVDGVLLRPAPVEAIDRLVVAWETDRNSGTTREPASFPDFEDYRRLSERVDGLGAFTGRQVNLTPESGDPSRLRALAVTHDLLPLLGARPILGRGFTAAEDRPGGGNVVLLGEGFWNRLYGRDPEVLGRTVVLNDTPFTVVGVMPADADFGVFSILSAADYSRSFADGGIRTDVNIWMPLQADAEIYPRRTHPIFMVGRLAPGATLETTQEEFARLAAQLEADYPENDARGVFVEPLATVVFGPVRPALLVLLGAVALVLLVACANVANLLLARAAARRREVAVRTALGVGMAGLARQFLVESLLLTGAAAVLGVLVARVGVDILVGLAPPALPRIGEASVDLRVLTVTLVVSVLVGLVFGMLPTLQAQRVDGHGALKGEGGARRLGRRRTTAPACGTRRGRAGARGRARRRGHAAHQELRPTPRRRPGLPRGWGPQSRVPAAVEPISGGLLQMARLHRGPHVHDPAPRAGIHDPGRRFGGDRRRPSARSRLHQFLLDRRARGGGEVVAGDQRPPRDARILSDPGDPAGSWPADR